MFNDLPLAAPATYQGYMMATQMISGIIAQQTGKAPAIMLPPLGVIMPHLSPAGAGAWTDDAGFHYRSICPFPGSSLLAPQGGMSMTKVSALSLGVGVALPALGVARRTARQMQSNTQARGIHQAMVTYAQGNSNVMPDDIGVLIEGFYFTQEYAISPMSRKTIPPDYGKWEQDEKNDWVRRNSSFILVPALMDDIDTEKIAVFGNPEDFDGRGIPVAYNDNHVVWETDLEDVKARLKAQTGKTMEQLIQRQAELAD